MNKLLFLFVLLSLSSNVFAESINSSPKEVSRSEIIEKLSAINSLYYEMTSRTSSDTPLPGGDAISDEKVWFKEGYWRTDIHSESANAKKRINISTPEASYFYNSFSDETKKRDGGAGQDLKNFLFRFFFATLKREESFKILGTEEIDGKITTILEIIQSPKKMNVEGQDISIKEKRIKVWIWNEKGVPLKQEEKWQDNDFPIEYTTMITYKNYSFDEIPSEIFDILKE